MYVGCMHLQPITFHGLMHIYIFYFQTNILLQKHKEMQTKLPISEMAHPQQF